MVLDMEMRELYNDLPPDFKMKPISQSFMDASSSIMNRCNVQLLYLKGIVVLHRRYLNAEPSSPEHGKSRRACLDAALSILSIQSDLHKASQPGGQLYNDRWMMSSFNAHDFLLAAMVVCLTCLYICGIPMKREAIFPWNSWRLSRYRTRFGRLLAYTPKTPPLLRWHWK